MTEKQIDQILKELICTDIIEASQIPDIPLYMDQVTTFVEDHLSSLKRNENDKILTKTMINNYTKFGLINPPIKKKYDKNSIIKLILIYYFKNIISINDIKEILTGFEEDKNQFYYDFFTKLQQYDNEDMLKSLSAEADRLFDEDTDEKTGCLFIALMLINQANIRKQAAERLIDKYLSDGDNDGKKKADKKN